MNFKMHYDWEPAHLRVGEPWKLLNYDTGNADTFYTSLDEVNMDLRPYTEPGKWRDDYDRFVEEGETHHQAWLKSLHIQLEQARASRE